MRLARVAAFLVLSPLLLVVSVRAQCGSSSTSTTWSDGNGSWAVSSNWTSGLPNDSTLYACILDGTSTVTLDTGESILGLQLASGNGLNINTSGGLNMFGGPKSPTGIRNSGTINNIGGISVAQSELTNSGQLNNSGAIGLSLSGLENSGNLNNSGAAIINIEGPITNSGTVNNSGTINQYYFGGIDPQFTNSGIINNSGTLSNSGTLNNSGTVNNSGTINNSVGTFMNSGNVTISSAGLFTTTLDNNYIQTAGSTILDGTLTATGDATIVDIQGGILGGTGTINGNVLMAGTMMPGDAPGTLTIIGNYEQTSTGIFYEQMSPYSQAFLDVSGNVVLDQGAMLEIALLNGYDPLGQTISIMDFSALSGQFANGSSFWDDGYLWDITYRQHEIDVSAVQAPEPSSLLLLFIGITALAFYAHRKMDKTESLA